MGLKVRQTEKSNSFFRFSTVRYLFILIKYQSLVLSKLFVQARSRYISVSVWKIFNFFHQLIRQCFCQYLEKLSGISIDIVDSDEIISFLKNLNTKVLVIKKIISFSWIDDFVSGILT